MGIDRASNLEISDWTEPEAAAFMDAEWRAHDAPLGLVWDGHTITLVARCDDGPVGAARGSVGAGVGILGQLLVKKDVARSGIGSQLLGEFEARCRRLKCHKVRLETSDYQARPFYERHGFTAVATLTNDRFGRSCFVMEKKL